jgi:hypothetical protein
MVNKSKPTIITRISIAPFPSSSATDSSLERSGVTSEDGSSTNVSVSKPSVLSVLSGV